MHLYHRHRAGWGTSADTARAPRTPHTTHPKPERRTDRGGGGPTNVLSSASATSARPMLSRASASAKSVAPGRWRAGVALARATPDRYMTSLVLPSLLGFWEELGPNRTNLAIWARVAKKRASRRALVVRLDRVDLLSPRHGLRSGARATGVCFQHALAAHVWPGSAASGAHSCAL